MLKRQMVIDKAALAAERKKAEHAAKQHKIALTAAAAVRDTPESGAKRVRDTPPTSPPDGFAASKSVRGRFVSLTTPAVSGSAISASAVQTAVRLALEGTPHMKAAVRGSGKASPGRTSALCGAVANQLLQLPEYALDSLLADKAALSTAAAQSLAEVLSPAPAAAEGSASGTDSKRLRRTGHPAHPGLARASPAPPAPRGDPSAPAAGAAAEADHPVAPVAAGAGGSD
jgi:hypothetical protein